MYSSCLILPCRHNPGQSATLDYKPSASLCQHVGTESRGQGQELLNLKGRIGLFRFRQAFHFR